MRYFLVFVCLVTQVALAGNDNHYKSVELKEFTSLDLHLVPDLGTRLIFPFVLDDTSHQPPLHVKNTNATQIKTTFDEGGKEKASGQNVFVIHALAPGDGMPVQKMLSDLFISVDGYNISIRLHITDRLNKHIQNVVFTISDEERFALIERQVEARLKQSREELDERKQRLEERSKDMAVSNMGIIAMNQPNIIQLKERIKNKLVTGERIDLLLSSFRNYEDEYYMLDIKIDNQSPKTINLESIDLSSISREAVEPLDTSFHCENDSTLLADKKTRCLLITSDPSMIRASELKINVGTNYGSLEGIW